MESQHVDVLVIAPSSERSPAVQSLVELGRACVVDSIEAAVSAAGKATFRDVVIDAPDPETAVAIAQSRAASAPMASSIRRWLLLASYAELPVLIRLGAARLVDHVIPRETLTPLLRGGEPRPASSSLSVGRPANSREALAVLASVGELAAAFVGTVVRPSSTAKQYLEIQLVLRQGSELESLRAQLGAAWQTLKARGQPGSRQLRTHAVSRSVGPLSRGQELFVQDIGNGDGHVYAAFLPWAGDGQVTLVLGLVGRADVAAPDLMTLHANVVRQCREYLLPIPPWRVDGAEPVVWFAKEYSWVVTRSYVGPDRRERPTSLLNRYMLSGRRKLLPENSQNFSARYVDRVHPTVARLAVAYVLLSISDTALSALYIRVAGYSELNPFLRPLLEWHPIAFAVVKNALSLAALVLVIRLQAWRLGKAALWANLLLYGALNAYWLWLLVAGPQK